MITIKRNFTVNGVEFVHWFNTQFLPKYDFLFRNTYSKNAPAPRITNVNQFRVVVNNIHLVSGLQDTPLNEFLAYFLLFYNETGATFMPTSEMGNDAYFFEKGTGVTNQSVYGNSLAWKGSYNAPEMGNVPAGTLLYQLGVISQQEVDIWNSTNDYPHQANESVKLEARNCDFYKFRGRGFIQTTWRNNYIRTVQPLLNGVQVVDMTNEELDKAFQDVNVSLGAVRNFYQLDIGGQYAVSRAREGDFDDIARVTAGAGNIAYIQEYVHRATALVNELANAFIQDLPEVDSAIFSLNRLQTIELQKALISLNENFATRINNAGGADGVAGATTIAVFQESGKKVSELISL